METRRLILAAVLSLAVLFLWQIIFPPEEQPLPAPAEQQQVVPPAAPPATEPATREESAPAGTVEAPAPGVTADSPVREVVEAASEERVVVEMPQYRTTFTNRGAQLVSFELAEHTSADRQGHVDLVRARRDGLYPLALLDAAGQPLAVDDALFAVSRSAVEGGSEVVEFRYSGPAGSASKRFVLRPDGLFEMEIALPGERDWGVLLGPGLRNPTPDEVGNQFARRSAVYRVGDEVTVLDAQKVDEPAEVAGAGLRWIGLEDTFFLSVLIPTRPPAGVTVRPVLVVPDADGGPASFEPLPPKDQLSKEQKALARELEVLVRVDGSEWSARGYFGSKSYDQLESLGLGLEDTVERGRYLGVVVGPLHRGLEWIYDHVVGNYGWAIVLMTFLIRVLLFPLTYKSMASMQKMQQLNPKIQAIRQKSRGKLKDAKGRPNAEAQRKMNEEIMALYKAEGVNPAGGCLPMVIQLPILFAFYRLLYTTVELRHAPWILWVKDLTAFDPYYVLPIVMGASQFLQQKLTPASGDPMQRRIFLLMPVVFTVLFLKFPSGLVLYWLTNNLLTIVQQLVYNRLKGSPGSPPAARKRAEA